VLSTRPMIRSFVLVLSLALATTGCDQGVGQRCQSTADCEDGLVCVVVQERGVCQSSSTPVGADAATDAPARRRDRRHRDRRRAAGRRHARRVSSAYRRSTGTAAHGVGATAP
jgi:hypothetical protein